MKKIYVNGVGLTSKNIYGLQRYTYELMQELDHIVKKDTIEVLLPKPPEREISFENIYVRRLYEEDFLNKKPKYWSTLGFRKYVKKEKGISMELALNLPLLGADIVAIHDCIQEKFKENCDSLHLKFERYFYFVKTFINLKFSKEVITVSEFSKNDICQIYKIKKDKISVIYNSWQHFDRFGVNANILNELNLEKGKYCFSLGSKYYHKNFKWIIAAAKQNPQLKFIVTGNNPMTKDHLMEEADQVDNIIFTGYLCDESIKALMTFCKVFIHPSFYEGFGIPPLEAMSTGARCIVSNASALPEIYGNSVWYIDPNKYDNIDIEKIMQAEIEDNKNVLNRFAWKKSAEKLYEVIKRHQD